MADLRRQDYRQVVDAEHCVTFLRGKAQQVAARAPLAVDSGGKPGAFAARTLQAGWIADFAERDCLKPRQSLAVQSIYTAGR